MWRARWGSRCWASFPIESRLASLADQGRFAEVLNENLDDAAAAMRGIKRQRVIFQAGSREIPESPEQFA